VSNLSSAAGDTVTLYAQWTANTYTVAFNANGGSGTMTPQAFAYDAAQPLTANAFTKSNYSFNGWNTAADGGGTPYTDGQSVSNLTAASGATFELYAQWVNYSQGSGITFSDSPKDETIELGAAQSLSMSANDTLTITVSGFDTYQWYLDGKPLTGETNDTITLNAVDCRTGTHYLTVKVSKDGSAYSKTVTFNITL
jgi:hypothetical protein